MKRKIIFIFFILLFIHSLKISGNKSNVIINGKFLDVKMSSVNLLYYNVIKQDFHYFSVVRVNNDGNFQMKFQISEPIFCKFFEDFFYITPGDSVNIEILSDSLSSKGYHLSITGNNSSHYLFYSFGKSKEKINMDKSSNNFDGDWIKFKNLCEEKFKEDIDLLTEFVSKNKTSADFYDYYYTDIYCNYLLYVLLPLNSLKNYNLTLIENFLNTINVDSLFKIDKLYAHEQFRQFCAYYLKFIISKKINLDTHTNELINEYNYINLNYENRIKEYFLVFVFNKAINLKTKIATDLVKEIVNNSMDFDDVEIKDYIKSKYGVFANISKVLPDSIIQIPIVNIKGETMTLKEILISFKGKFLLIDNWATWCGPCLEEIEHAKLLIHSGDLEKNNIEILYLSQDADIRNWQKYSKKNSSTLKHSYKFKNIPNPFIEYFTINSIPRYILLGPDGELIDYAAPRLSDFNSILKIIK